MRDMDYEDYARWAAKEVRDVEKVLRKYPPTYSVDLIPRLVRAHSYLEQLIKVRKQELAALEKDRQ